MSEGFNIDSNSNGLSPPLRPWRNTLTTHLLFQARELIIVVSPRPFGRDGHAILFLPWQFSSEGVCI